MQIDVRKDRTDGTPLRDALVQMGDHPVFHDPGFQPMVQETDQSTIVDPVPNKLP
jgi:hypothetical protein